jgi:hypothetical protein
MGDRAWQMELRRRAQIDEQARVARKRDEEVDREWRARIDAISAYKARLWAAWEYGMDEPVAALPEMIEENEPLEEEPPSRSTEFEM